MEAFLIPLMGGLLLGLSASLLLLLNGKIAGVSGLVGGLVKGRLSAVNLAFIVGLVIAPLLYKGFGGTFGPFDVNAPISVVILAGLLVGFGSRMGSGCTSGHGILGLARLSKRSMVAVVTFITTGVLTVALLRVFA